MRFTTALVCALVLAAPAAKAAEAEAADTAQLDAFFPFPAAGLSSATVEKESDHVGVVAADGTVGDLPANTYFLRTFNASRPGGSHPVTPGVLPAYLDGLVHYRLIPGDFPKGFEYHFDGLAAVIKFKVSSGSVEWTSAPYESKAFELYPKCLFVGSGTGPTASTKPCLRNPGVNLLPIDGQLWLTIDTSLWGRVDPDTLETITAKAEIKSTVLNAHPACDRAAGLCYVQHPCDPKQYPLTKDVCFSILHTSDSDIGVEEVGRAMLPKNKLIQHSHSPCVTPNYVISKIDAFTARNPLNRNSGLLKYVHQSEDSLWLVMDRRTNSTRVMNGNAAFVNNHAWNCYESSAGEIIVEVVAATEHYLDTYFERNLAAAGSPGWNNIFHRPLRCHISPAAGNVTCTPLLEDASLLFDYPTFNPLYKMNGAYRYFYGIAPKSSQSSWFDSLIKVDVSTGQVAKTWAADGVFLTEFDFVPEGTSADGPEAEDAGSLVSVLYNSTSDQSLFGIFDATTLTPRVLVPMDQVVPFHAHGIVCPGSSGKDTTTCFTNP